MSFELKHNESVGEGLQRIAVEQVDDALELLKKKSANDVETVHEVRKDAKKVRAVLRLARTDLNSSTFRFENEFFRDVGHQLSDASDAQILLEAVDKLREHKHSENSSFEKVHSVLLQQRDALNALLKAKNLPQAIQEELSAVRKRINKWKINMLSFSRLGAGVRNSYKRGRDARELAYSSPTFANFHDWRKRVKDLHYQVRILQPLWPEVMQTLHDETGQLGDLLGDDHDLGVLEQLLKVKPALFGGLAQLRGLLRLIDRRRAQLRKDARLLGEKVYQDKPRIFAERFEAAWQI